MSQARLMRSESDKVVAGVCGGVASYLDVDSVFVRLAFLLLFLASGVGLILYIILMIIMPLETKLDIDSKQVFQENIDEYSEDLSANIDRVKRHPQGKSIAAGLLIIMGLFLLFSNLGLLNWLSGGTFWALLLIGLGIYFVVKRNR